MQPLNPGLVNQNFEDSSPAADAVDTFDQPTDLDGDIDGEIAAFSLNSCQRYKEFPIQLIRCGPNAF
jgi:hypothetical protein